MKKLISLFISLAFAGSSFAQMSGYSSSQSDGTTLGANETLTADGIALGNAVKLRGYVDFVFKYDDEDNSNQNEQFDTTADVDFLFDLSPITAELHLTADADDGAELEQVFGRYSVSQDFHVTFGRQLTVLGFEADEAPGLFAVTHGHTLADAVFGDLLVEDQNVLSGVRRNYVDGIRLNYNNGMFGLSGGLHDGYWGGDDFNGDNIAIDIAASVMFFPGLEARVGFAHQSLDVESSTELYNSIRPEYSTTPISAWFIPAPTKDGDINQFNIWLGYNPGALTLATEFDTYDFDIGNGGSDTEYWSWMLLANYQFTDWFAATLRYTHEDFELGSGHSTDSDRFTIATLFTLTEHFGINVEYSTTSTDNSAVATSAGLDQGDYDEFLVEGLITY
jgi:hypothetical protein